MAAPSRACAQVFPDSTDQVLLQLVDAALETAIRTPTPWPGYEAASQPLVVYRPGGWRILLNPPSSAPEKDWVRYAPSWSALSRPAWLDADGDSSLVGQLAFDYPAPGGLSVAIPLYENLGPEYGSGGAYLFSFLVHEAFHQYQRHQFADVDTPSEERYPMLDAENNALAALEFLALRDAVRALGDGNAEGADDRARVAVAIHSARSLQLDDEARAIERSKEVVEGTAKYVETRYVARFVELCRTGAVPPLQSLCRSFEGLDAPRWLEDDFNRRLTDGAIAPSDMARNRIYPVAAAVALLLDVYEPDWKEVVEREGTSRGLFEHLEIALDLPQEARATLVEQARRRYHGDRILASTRVRVREYLDQFDEAMSAFDALPGVRLVVQLPASGISRSRSSREQRFVVDAGRRTLGHFLVYTLRRQSEPAVELRLQDSMVLDEIDHQGERTVTVHISEPLTITVDDERVALDFTGTRTFHRISLAATGATFHADVPGMLTLRPGELQVALYRAGG